MLEVVKNSRNTYKCLKDERKIEKQRCKRVKTVAKHKLGAATFQGIISSTC